VTILLYNYMQIIFGSGVATGRFAMVSSEPLRQPADGVINLEDQDDAAIVKGKVDERKYKKGKCQGHKDEEGVDKKGKRKRVVLSDEDATLLTGMTDVVWGLGAAIKEENHAEVAPRVYDVVMGCPYFARSNFMLCLNHLMDHKGPAWYLSG